MDEPSLLALTTAGVMGLAAGFAAEALWHRGLLRFSPTAFETTRPTGCAAVAGGSQNVSVIATSGTELRQTASAKVAVLAPSLNLTVDGPALRYVGRDARYSLKLANDGQAVTNNVRAMYVVPKGFEYLYSSRGGKYDEATRTVTWFVGSVSPKEAIDLSLGQRVRAVHLQRVLGRQHKERALDW